MPWQRLAIALEGALVLALYVAAGWWALGLGPVNGYAAPLWPPTGIAIAALFLFGYRLWPAIALGAFALNMAAGAPVLAAIGITIGNTMEAAMAVYLLRNFRLNPLFGRLADSIGFIIVAIAATVISAIIGPVALALFGALPPVALPETSFTWWLGDIVGALVIAPLLIRWLAHPLTDVRPTSVLQIIENVAFFAALIVVSLLAFIEPIPGSSAVAQPYLVFVPLTWGALRVGPRMMTMAVASVGAIAALGAMAGVGPFIEPLFSPNELFPLQLYLGMLAIIFLLFVAAVEDRKTAARRLAQHAAALAEDVQTISEADSAKNDFIATLSHELRNPLAPILSNLEIMKTRRPENGELHELIDSTHQNVMRIARLLDDLLDVARISRKKFTLQREYVGLKKLIESSVAMAEPTMRQRDHAFNANISVGDAKLYADPVRIEQIIVNLLNNAAKYTPRGGVISLSARVAGNDAEIRVRDNGVGIPPRALASIFEPFKQLNSRRTESTGLGIGLSLAQRLAELHSGVIRAQSAGEGKGSEFIVRLPIAGEPALLPAPANAAPAPSAEAGAAKENEQKGPKLAAPLTRPKKRTILIVDDNQKAADALAMLLNHTGHEARTAEDGARALALLADFRPDVIFLDIGLPDKDGYQVAAMIRGYLDPSPTLVALTGYGQEEDRQRAFDAGFDAHLVKPVSIAELEKVLSKA